MFHKATHYKQMLASMFTPKMRLRDVLFANGLWPSNWPLLAKWITNQHVTIQLSSLGVHIFVNVHEGLLTLVTQDTCKLYGSMHSMGIVDLTRKKAFDEITNKLGLASLEALSSAYLKLWINDFGTSYWWAFHDERRTILD